MMTSSYCIEPEAMDAFQLFLFDVCSPHRNTSRWKTHTRRQPVNLRWRHVQAEAMDVFENRLRVS